MSDDIKYGLVAIKRPWIPEWVWKACIMLFGPLVPMWPLRQILTIPVETEEKS